jgi:DNA gyrase subunit B
MNQQELMGELNALKSKLGELEKHVLRMGEASPRNAALENGAVSAGWIPGERVESPAGEYGGLYYAGHISMAGRQLRWGPQTREAAKLLELDGERGGKVLAALGHKQRLDILRTVLMEPQTGPELVERLGMGTTGQLYHHIKALAGADLLHQEERGGRYVVPGHRVLPLLLLLAAVTDLLETSDYLDMEEVRRNAGDYLLWSLFENAIAEHQAGYGTELHVIFHGDGSVTVADNGRGIPVTQLSGTEKSQVQSVLTDMKQLNGVSYQAPGAGKGIRVAVVNALSSRLTAEVRREDRVFRQEYRHGIPETGLMTVGVTKETGTSITFLPDPELFRNGFDPEAVERYSREAAEMYPGLNIRVLRS